MYPVSVLETIQDPKLRNFLESQYLRIIINIGYLFDVVIKRIDIDATMFDIDDIEYNSVDISFGIIPKPEVLFISTYRMIEDLGLPLTTKLIRVPPSIKRPLSINRYSLHRLMAPTFHGLNCNTFISKTKVTTDVKLYSEDVVETHFGGVVGKPIQFSFL